MLKVPLGKKNGKANYSRNVLYELTCKMKKELIPKSCHLRCQTDLQDWSSHFHCIFQFPVLVCDEQTPVMPFISFRL
ncbi:hypothetical protein Avbf_04318 [Armadillidium vulgare]|nr:hypothetical protein Avbf_04318 [Armadillidium vulgare]